MTPRERRFAARCPGCTDERSANDRPAFRSIVDRAETHHLPVDEAMRLAAADDEGRRPRPVVASDGGRVHPPRQTALGPLEGLTPSDLAALGLFAAVAFVALSGSG